MAFSKVSPAFSYKRSTTMETVLIALVVLSLLGGGGWDTLVGAARLERGPHSAHIQVARSTPERSTGSAIDSRCSFPSELKICSAPCNLCLGFTG
jgi:hypothetical protein